jgi:hypothetical protein
LFAAVRFAARGEARDENELMESSALEFVVVTCHVDLLAWRRYGCGLGEFLVREKRYDDSPWSVQFSRIYPGCDTHPVLVNNNLYLHARRTRVHESL